MKWDQVGQVGHSISTPLHDQRMLVLHTLYKKKIHTLYIKDGLKTLNSYCTQKKVDKLLKLYKKEEGY